MVGGQPIELTEEVTTMGFENVAVPAGTFSNVLKLMRTTTVMLGGTSTVVVGTETLWLAPGIGAVKRTLRTEDGGQIEIDTEELIRSVVDGVENSQGAQIRRIALNTNDLVYDRVSNRIYASVPGNPGSITTINPETGAIGLSIEVGNQPNKLALSDDGQFLYVGLDGESAVRRVHIPSFMAGLLIPVSLSPNNLFPICGTVRIGDIEVLPGVSNAVAISKYHSGCSLGLRKSPSMMTKYRDPILSRESISVLLSLTC